MISPDDANAGEYAGQVLEKLRAQMAIDEGFSTEYGFSWDSRPISNDIICSGFGIELFLAVKGVMVFSLQVRKRFIIFKERRQGFDVSIVAGSKRTIQASQLLVLCDAQA